MGNFPIKPTLSPLCPLDFSSIWGENYTLLNGGLRTKTPPPPFSSPQPETPLLSFLSYFLSPFIFSLHFTPNQTNPYSGALRSN